MQGQIKQFVMQRRIRTFFANWWGIILATIIVALVAAFGGLHLYSTSRVNGALAWVTQDITLVSITSSGQLDNPPRAIYHMIMRVDNPSSDAASAEISDINITLDEFNLPVMAVGLWQKTINPTGYEQFDGNITLDATTLKTLTDRGTVTLEIRGNIKATAQYNWVNKNLERPIKITTTANLNPPK